MPVPVGRLGGMVIYLRPPSPATVWPVATLEQDEDGDGEVLATVLGARTRYRLALHACHATAALGGAGCASTAEYATEMLDEAEKDIRAMRAMLV